MSADDLSPDATAALGLFGWNDFFHSQYLTVAEDGDQPARIICAQRGIYQAETQHGVRDAVLSGRLRHQIEADPSGDSNELPTVGDWVLLENALKEVEAGEILRIRAVLPRRTQLSRKQAGRRTRKQLVAANIEVVFLVMGLDGDYNPRRLERLLTMVWDSGARPVVVLNKSDLCDDLEERRTEIEELTLGAPLHVVSCLEDEQLDTLRSELKVGETIALLGSSGVGKSTLINRLLGAERLRTGGVRESDDRGKHTTTHRELVRLPDGALLIDNPGIREIQLWEAGDGIDQTFADIAQFAQDCRFSDCLHDDEPGCAVRAAVEDGTLDASRLASRNKLLREQASLELRLDERARRAAERKTGKLYRNVIAEKKERLGRR